MRMHQRLQRTSRTCASEWSRASKAPPSDPAARRGSQNHRRVENIFGGGAYALPTTQACATSAKIACRSGSRNARNSPTSHATLHMLGHVQSNKASRVAQLFHRVDSLDSLALAKKLDSAAAAEKKRLPVLIEVHLSGEESKSGVAEADLAALAEATSCLAHLDLQGLMTIPPYFDDAERARPYFRKLRELRDGLSAKIGRELPVLSMGMSHDFEVAIEEGATEVRIGTAIFGEREQKA